MNSRYWLRRLQEINRPHLKLADAGDGQDGSFEQAFAEMARICLRDKAPALQDYEVGFQLLDRDQDGNRAVGIAGYKVGEEWLYAPVFFLHGAIRGQELLFIRSSNQFVPLKEKWVFYLLNRKPTVLGELSEQEGYPHPPDLHSFKYPPGLNKLSSCAPELLPGIAAFAYCANTDPWALYKQAKVPSLLDFLRKEADWALEPLGEILPRCPAISSFFDQEHGLGNISKLIDQVLKKIPSVLDGKVEASSLSPVRVYKAEITLELGPDELTDKQKKKLLQDGELIVDERSDKQVTQVFRDEILDLASPSGPGVYDLLFQPDQLVRCVVIPALHTTRLREPWALVIPMDDPGGFFLEKPGKLWAKLRQEESEREAFVDWWKKLPKLEDEPLQTCCSCGSYYVFVNSRGQATVPLRLNKFMGGNEREQHWSATPEIHFSLGCGMAECWKIAPDVQVTIRLDGGEDLQEKDRHFIIPAKAFRCVKLPMQACNTEPLIPATWANIQYLMRRKLEPMQVLKKEGSYCIDGVGYSPWDALVHLVKDKGLRESEARWVLKQAGVLPKSFLLKKAILGPGPSVPSPYVQDVAGEMLGSVPAVTMRESLQPVVIAREPHRQEPLAPDPRAVQIAMQAAQGQQKELFDAAMITSLLSTVSLPNLIDRYLGVLMKALDHLGRILFSLYWHRDKFQERYGKQDLPELEDQLRATFEQLGDLVLFLREKTIDPYHDELLLGTEE
ncbi:MAG: hypothetical protein QXS68_06505 [Candidatus Methanomethylicaceae archaeon]